MILRIRTPARRVRMRSGNVGGCGRISEPVSLDWHARVCRSAVPATTHILSLLRSIIPVRFERGEERGEDLLAIDAVGCRIQIDVAHPGIAIREHLKKIINLDDRRVNPRDGPLARWVCPIT